MSSPSLPTFSRPPLPDLPEGKTTVLLRDPIPTPDLPDASAISFTIFARVPIAAPPTTALRALLDTASWPRWNTFIPAAEVHSRGTPVPSLPGSADYLGIGAKFTMCVNMDGKPEAERGPVEKLRKSNLILYLVEELVPEREEGRKGWRIAWKGDGGFMLKPDRVQELVETDDGCEYVGYESFGGLLAPVVRLAVGAALVDRIADQGRDLKAWCEGEGRGE
ncbi:hypothetical protein V494_06518 [Pseudogymnoascus sp. VKM F-4513 (FW-928)]|nr:hypothetical protein V494_06518 [Pseudogymnoascus sp. VKM F-4513 (FW-928)]